MALKAFLENLDGLSTELTAEYKEVDGGFQLDVTPHDSLELVDTTNLKSALVKERKAKDKAINGAKVYEGLDATEARAAITKLAELGDLTELDNLDEKLAKRQAQLETKFETDRVRLTEKHTGELGERDKQIKGLTGQLHGELINSASLKAIAAADGSPELLLPVIRGNVKVTEGEEGQLVAKVYDANGQVRLSSKAGSSSDMTIDEYVGELRSSETYSRAFNGSGASGGGSSSPGGSGNRGGNQHTISASDAKNPALYRAAKSEAAKAGVSLTMTE